jgi:ferritin-like metal-binding protein YciE
MCNSRLEEALVEELRDLLDAEKRLTKALPKLAKAAESEELVAAFESHNEETKKQVQRLEEALQSLGQKPLGKPCGAMKGLLAEGDELKGEADQGALRDAMLIAAAQKVEHYEIASYGTVIVWAEQLGLKKIVSLLSRTLDEEKAADEKLNGIAEELNTLAEVSQ